MRGRRQYGCDEEIGSLEGKDRGGEIPERKVAMVRRERRSWKRICDEENEGFGSGRRRTVEWDAGGGSWRMAGNGEMEGMAVRRSGVRRQQRRPEAGGSGGGLRTAASR